MFKNSVWPMVEQRDGHAVATIERIRGIFPGTSATAKTIGAEWTGKAGGAEL